MKKNYGKIAAVTVAAALAAGIMFVPATGSTFALAANPSGGTSSGSTTTTSTTTTTATTNTTAATDATTTTAATTTAETSVLSDAAVSQAATEITAAAPGATVNVGMSATTTTVPATLMLDAAGKDVVLRFDFGTYAWSVDGRSITNAQNVNLEVKPGSTVPADRVNTLAGANPTVQLSLTANGDLGCTATLTYNMGAQYAGKYANLFWYKADGTFEAISNSAIDANGYSNLTFTHASEYVVVISDKAMGESSATKANTATSTTTSPKTGEPMFIF